ncbi:hypothetical protein [Nostoc sp. CALU 1950]|uniref:hypothetical protein n=1 Tax=Nostoc sp. CALU 1950 TaxID=3104321 RepID=UPI003EB8C504
MSKGAMRSLLHQHEVFTAKQEGLDATNGASFQLRRHGFRQDKDETQQYSRLVVCPINFAGLRDPRLL